MASHLESDGATNAQAARKDAYSPIQRRVALAYGVACHALFALAIASMIYSIDRGLTAGFGPFEGAAAWVANLLLIVQFPLLHSWLLSRPGRSFLNRLAPVGLGRDLAATNFAAISSLQLLALFGLWSPSQVVWWRAENGMYLASSALYAASWLLLLKAMVDAGLDLQSGFCGWGAVVRNRRPQRSPFPTHGLYRYTRQPIYVAFFLTLWTAPVWTPDRLLLAVALSPYCWFGPLLKEHRYLRFEGERYRRYQSLVPYWLPSARPCALAPALAARADEPPHRT